MTQLPKKCLWSQNIGDSCNTTANTCRNSSVGSQLVLRSAHTMGLVASCKLAIFASKSSRRDQLWSPRQVPRDQTSLNFWDKSLRLVPQNASCELFVGQVSVPVPSCKLFKGLVAGTVAGTSPLECADL